MNHLSSISSGITPVEGHPTRPDQMSGPALVARDWPGTAPFSSSWMSPSRLRRLRVGAPQLAQGGPHAHVDVGALRVLLPDLVLEIRVVQRAHVLREVGREHLTRCGQPVAIVEVGRPGDGRPVAVARDEVGEVVEILAHAAADEESLVRCFRVSVLDDGKKTSRRNDPHLEKDNYPGRTSDVRGPSGNCGL